MSRIAAVFGKPGHKALVPYITVGYPRLDSTLPAAGVLAAAGADILELGIPFSDPLADGATIQASSYRALQNGVNTRLCLDTAHSIRRQSDIPLVFMTYFNPVLNYGPDEFCRACAGAGIDGLIVPDLPPEEGEALAGTAASLGIDLIYLLSPASTAERIRIVAAKSRGYIYLVSVTGVTGARSTLPPSLTGFVQRVREVAHQPLCVGFGISGAEQARQVAAVADGVIVGSRLIQLMAEDETLKRLGAFTRELRTAIGE